LIEEAQLKIDNDNYQFSIANGQGLGGYHGN